MAAAREGTVPKRYSNDIFFTGLLFRKKTRTKTNDRKLYPVVVTIVDKVAMRVKTRSLDTVKSSMSSGHAVLRLTTTLFSAWNLFLPRL